ATGFALLLQFLQQLLGFLGRLRVRIFFDDFFAMISSEVFLAVPDERFNIFEVSGGVALFLGGGVLGGLNLFFLGGRLNFHRFFRLLHWRFGEMLADQQIAN